jgi:hypothetical protein
MWALLVVAAATCEIEEKALPRRAARYCPGLSKPYRGVAIGGKLNSTQLLMWLRLLLVCIKATARHTIDRNSIGRLVISCSG